MPPIPEPQRASGRYGKITRASAIKPRKQRWLIPDMIPLNTMTIFAGAGGEGKSTMVLDIAAKLSRGELEGDVTEPASTLILSVEDDWETVMVPRLMAARADLDYILKFDVESYVAESGESFETKAVLPLDVDGISDIVREHNVKLIVFDPAQSFMTGDPNKGIDVRRSFEPISQIAQSHDLAVLLIAHFNKDSGSVGSKLSGSHAWRDLTRSYWGFAADEDSGKRVFSQDKGNYSKTTGASFEFDIVDTPVEIDGRLEGLGAVGNIQKTDVTVGDIISREVEAAPSGLDECAGWLLAFLDEEPFEKARAQIIAAGKKEGFALRTIERAKAKIGAGDYRSGFGGAGFWTHPRIAHAHAAGATGGTDENGDVSAGQNSYATVPPSNRFWRDYGVNGVTRANAAENASPASSATGGDVAELQTNSHVDLWGNPTPTDDETHTEDDTVPCRKCGRPVKGPYARLNGAIHPSCREEIKIA